VKPPLCGHHVTYRGTSILPHGVLYRDGNGGYEADISSGWPNKYQLKISKADQVIK